MTARNGQQPIPPAVQAALEAALAKARELGYDVDSRDYGEGGLEGALVDEARRLPFQPDPGPITMTETGAAMLLVDAAGWGRPSAPLRQGDRRLLRAARAGHAERQVPLAGQDDDRRASHTQSKRR